MKKQHVLIGLFLITVQFSLAQFTLSGEFKPRLEFRNGYGNLIADPGYPGFATSTRARLNGDFITEGYHLYLSIQDVMVWGENRQIQPHDSNNSFAVFEAWGEFKLCEGLTTKLGRQQLVYDDERILGGLDWAQQGRNHDVALLKYKKGEIVIDLALAYNQDFSDPSGFRSLGNGYNTSDYFSYKAMQMLHANQKIGNLAASLLFLNTTHENELIGLSKSVDLQTFGTHLKYEKGAFSTAFNFYLQMGKALYSKTVSGVSTGSYQKVNGAYDVGLELGYKVSDKVKLGVGAELLSGDSDMAGDKTTAFFPLYGTNHKFNGFMDYFYVGNHANSVGLLDIHACADFTLSEKSSLMLKVLNFSGAEKLPSGQTDLGNEIDLVFTKKCKGFVWLTGYSHLFPSDGMYELMSVRTGALVTKNNTSSIQNWAWTMLVLKPKFINGQH